MDHPYSFQTLSQILLDFYRLTDLRIAFMNREFQEILAYPSRLSDFCKEYRTRESNNKKCLQCDYSAFSHCRQIRQPYLYQCHLGLTEIIVPILLEGKILGYLMCGQLLCDRPANTRSLPASALEKLNPVSEEKLFSTLRMLEVIAQHLLHSDFVVQNTNSLSYKLDQYILAHLSEDLSIERIAHAFGYRKTTFCSLAQKFYGTGIMQHVRRLRVQEAKRYLSSTALPIHKIAVLVGIPDYNYFTKVFRAETQCTPREFRKNAISNIYLQDLYQKSGLFP